MQNKAIKKTTNRISWRYVYVGILLLAVFIQYGQTLDYGFVWDDKIVIQENPRVKNGIEAIPELFAKFKSPYRHDQYGYRPITLLSFALEIEFWGVNPYYHHLMNLLYYALLCIMIYYFLLNLFKNYHSVFSFLIALIFTVHPLHVEVVANIKSRDEILAMLFVILSLFSYLVFIRKNKIFYWGIAVLFYLLAFLSKENAITSLLLYPLVYIFEYKETLPIKIKSFILSNLHIVILLIVSVLIFQIAESSELGKNEMLERNIVKEDDILGNSLFHTDGLFNKLPTVLVILLLYLKQFIIPYPLVFYYGYNHVPVRGWIDIWVVLSIIILAVLAYVIYRYRKTNPELWFGSLFFIFTISIYLHIIRKLSDTMADRFMFMPSLGLCILFLGLIAVILKFSWINQPALKHSKIKLDISLRMVVGGSMVIILIYTVLSYNRGGVWKSDRTLVFTDIKHLENCSRVHYYYANILWTDIKNKPYLKNKLEKDMIAHYERSIEIAPEYVYYSRMELAQYYYSQQRYHDALALLYELDKYFPEKGPVLYNIAQNLFYLGRYEEAKGLLEKVTILAPHYSATPYYLALSESKIGNHEKALQIIKKAQIDFPNEKVMYKDALTVIYADMKDKDKFVSAMLDLLNLGANPAGVYRRIIMQLESWGMMEEANKYKNIAGEKGIKLY